MSGRLYGDLVTAIPTAPLAAAGLIGGYLVASTTGNRLLGGLVFFAVGGLCTHSWLRSQGPGVAGGLLGTYVVALIASHPLARQIGAWPSVLTVSALTAAATFLAADRRVGAHLTPARR